MKSRSRGMHHKSLHTRHFKHRSRNIDPDGSKRIQRIGDRAVPVPDRLYCNLHYAGTPENINIGAGNQFKSYVANGPYDPDPSVGGTTAAYYSELGLSYQNYIVWGSAIRVYVTPNTNSDSPAVVGVWPCTTTSTGSLACPKDFAALVVTPGAKWCHVQEYTKSLSVVSNKLLIKDYMAQSADGSISWQGVAPGATKTLDSGSNPTSPLYWVVGVFAPDGVAGDANVYITAEITYFTEFSTRTVPYGYNNNSFTLDIDPITDKPTDLQPPSRIEEKEEFHTPKEPEDDIMSDSVFIDKLKCVLKDKL